MYTTIKYRLAIYAIILVGIATVLSSCGNCRWVEDCRCEDGGYWDCPEDPVQPTQATPKLQVDIESKRLSGVNKTTTFYTIVIKNSGYGIAKNVRYHLTINRPYFEGGVGTKTMFEETTKDLSIPPSQNLTLSKAVAENITISGGGLYSVSINISYTDVQGNTYSTSEYYDR